METKKGTLAIITPAATKAGKIYHKMEMADGFKVNNFTAEAGFFKVGDNVIMRGDKDASGKYWNLKDMLHDEPNDNYDYGEETIKPVEVVKVGEPTRIGVPQSITNRDKQIAKAVALKAAVELYGEYDLLETIADVKQVAKEFTDWLLE